MWIPFYFFWISLMIKYFFLFFLLDGHKKM